LVAILQDNVAKAALLDPAIEVIDSYFTQGTEDAVFDEPAYLNAFNADLNAFLKWEKLGKDEDSTPRLRSTLAITKQVMGRTMGGHPSQRSILIAAVKQAMELAKL
jgi:hypothetical protein